MYKVEKINRSIHFVLLSITVSILITSCASTKENTSNGQLVIQQQGSFAVGGTVITNPGTFDPIKHGAFNPTNQPSEGRGPGWRTAIQNNNVKAIVSFEPGGDFVFPEGETPDTIKVSGRTIIPPSVPIGDFIKLTKIPIIIYYGDNIPDQPSVNPGQEQWRAFLTIAKQFREVVNKHGGDVTLIHLPEIGIKGNTHFPMSDLNNLEIANHLSEFLKKKGLD